jgi:hypothetical protein
MKPSSHQASSLNPSWNFLIRTLRWEACDHRQFIRPSCETDHRRDIRQGPGLRQRKGVGSAAREAEAEAEADAEDACMEGCSVLPRRLPPGLICPLFGMAVELVLGS